MKSNNRYLGINPKIIKQIRKRARRLKSFRCFADYSIEDIEQELLCETWSDLNQYSGDESGQDAFIHSIIKNRAINLVRKQSCAKRDSKAGILFIDITELGNVVDKSSHFENKVAANIDISTTISKLPKLWQDICYDLQSYSICEIAKMYKISRTTVYHIRRQIRAKLSHLKIYL
ncbi:sigma-70 family RNA polymerase sigma factor [Candidatus Mesenet endosymbiont of Agriotes lineatus]|uniref:sigma-70 family RNA polymerase sigma factor n=1 Tax=Candidatus Mesenet endosymbiont of Agriotes lineatus TaxID=3077948 RepID=UPI0030D10369